MVPATKEHAHLLVGDLSEESRRSLYLFGPRSSLEALLGSLDVSRCAYAAFVADELLFIWGVREMGGGVAMGWFITSTAVARHRKAFWRATKEIVRILHDRYRLLTNVIHPENLQTLRWAKGMGFMVHPPENRHGVVFRRAEMVRPSRV